MDKTHRISRHAGRLHADGGGARNGPRSPGPSGSADNGWRANKTLFGPFALGQTPAAPRALGGHGWRNQRLIDILTVLAILGLLLAGYRYFGPTDMPTQTSFIVPSQHVHW